MYAYVLSEGLGRSLGPLGLVYITGRKNVRHDWCSVGDDDAADFQSATGPKSQNTTPYRFQPPFPGKLARQSMGRGDSRGGGRAGRQGRSGSYNCVQVV